MQLRGSEIMVIPSGTTHRGQKEMRLPSTLYAIVNPGQSLYVWRGRSWTQWR
jgi:hypothetical protein